MKKFMKGLLATTMVFAMMTSLVGCGGGSEAEAPADETATLVMATNAAFPPYEFYEGDAIVGIDAEIGAAIAEKLGMDFVIEDMEFDAIIPAVTSGKASFGMAGMTVTEERLESINFSDTYAHATQVVIVTEGSPITGVADLDGKKVGVQLGTTGDIYAEDIADGPFAGVEAVGKHGYPYFRNRCFIMARSGADADKIAALKALYGEILADAEVTEWLGNTMLLEVDTMTEDQVLEHIENVKNIVNEYYDLVAN